MGMNQRLGAQGALGGVATIVVQALDGLCKGCTELHDGVVKVMEFGGRDGCAGRHIPKRRERRW